MNQVATVEWGIASPDVTALLWHYQWPLRGVLAIGCACGGYWLGRQEGDRVIVTRGMKKQIDNADNLKMIHHREE